MGTKGKTHENRDLPPPLHMAASQTWGSPNLGEGEGRERETERREGVEEQEIIG